MYHNPGERGWGSLPPATDKDLKKESPGVRSGQVGGICAAQRRVRNHNGVQHVCGSKARGAIQGHVPGERSVSSPPILFIFICHSSGRSTPL